MPDVVRYVYRYELLTTFLGAVAALLLISDSDFGSEQIVPARWDHLVPRAGTGAAAAAPVPALHPCITYEFLHEKHSKFKSITHVQIASRFLDWNTRDIARWRFAGETPAKSVTCITTEKAKRDWNASDAVFLPFSDGENHLSIGSMVQRYKSDSEKRPGRSGRSLGRS